MENFPYQQHSTRFNWQYACTLLCWVRFITGDSQSRDEIPSEIESHSLIAYFGWVKVRHRLCGCGCRRCKMRMNDYANADANPNPAGMTNYRIGPHRTASDHIVLHLTKSDKTAQRRLQRPLTYCRSIPVVNHALAHSRKCGITESSTDPPAVPPANLVSDAFGKRRPVARCGGGSVTAGTTGCGWVKSCRFWSIIT